MQKDKSNTLTLSNSISTLVIFVHANKSKKCLLIKHGKSLLVSCLQCRNDNSFTFITFEKSLIPQHCDKFNFLIVNMEYQ